MGVNIALPLLLHARVVGTQPRVLHREAAASHVLYLQTHQVQVRQLGKLQDNAV